MSDIANRIAALSVEKRDLLMRQVQERRNTASATFEQYDVAILGGGMAGLTLALQLKKERPATRILVVEKQKHPVPEATHKVGESTVEIGSGYLRDVLGLEEHLKTQQLRKFGLRMFFSADDNQDIARRVEVGPSAPPSLHTYQIDRGRLENMLGSTIQQQGITFLDACKVKQISLQQNYHSLQLQEQDRAFGIVARWVVDASGRSSLLKRRLGLVKDVAHNANAAWFRVGQTIDVNAWSNNAEWHARITDGDRSLSTNHLVGPGYWIWLIRLASGSTSVGIVTDPAIHPFEDINRFDRALAWLHIHEPQCANVIEQYRADVQDFLVMKNYAYSCRQVFSSERWCLTGESGVFTDPLYSPGADFIAIGNDLICDLISRDLNGEDIQARAAIHDQVFLSFADIWFGIYEQQYALLGNVQVMAAKIIWDVAAYWGIFGLLYFHDQFRRLGYNPELTAHLSRFSLLSIRVQAFFREWNALEQPAVTDTFVDYYTALAFMIELHAGMVTRLPAAELQAQFAANIQFFERLAGQMVSEVIEECAKHPDDAAMQRQVQFWQTDPFLANLLSLYQQGATSNPIDSNWINLAHKNKQAVEPNTRLVKS